MKLFIILAILTLNTLFANAKQDENLDKVSLQLHWKYQFEFAGFIAAKEKGFYKDAGLDVELREYKNGINVEDEVLSGRANYAIGNSYLLVDYLKGKPLKLIASFFKRASLILITKPSIKSPDTLVGKKIMAASKKDFKLNFQVIFDKYGINVNKLHFVPYSYSIDDFVSGKVDAMSANIFDQPVKLDKLGVKYNIIDPSDYGIYALQEEMFTSQNEVIKHPQRLKAFRDATIKGWEYAFKHKDEIVNIIFKKYSHNISKAFLKQEALEIEKLILPYTYNIGSIDKNFLNRQLELFNEYYKLDSTKAVDEYIYDFFTEDQMVLLTKNEKKYLQSHENLSVCIAYDLMPFDGYFNQRHLGVMSDVYKILSEKLNVKFKWILSSSYEEYKEHIKNKDCQIVSITTAKKTELNSGLLISEPFIETNFTLVSKLDKSFIQDIHSLKNKRLITQFPEFKEYILEYYPYLNVEVEPDKYKMVKKLMDDEIYAVVTLDEQADYLIDKYGYGKLKINGFLSKNYFVKGSVAVQKDEALLLSALQKSLSQISFFKIDKIMDSWRLTRYKKFIDYSLAWKILIVVGIIILIMIYYHRKLKIFNSELSTIVDKKTKELRELNESLEETVKTKMDKLIEQDKLLTMQSKQAVMGEMISMIAHQWRQPLSTITLQISSLQIAKLKGEKVDDELLYKALDNISDKIIYLSDTIDDFQTYFRPDREASVITLYEIFEKVNTLVAARLEASDVIFHMIKNENIELKVYTNELIQVLLNLVNNSIDALENVDRLQKNIYLYAKLENDRVSIYVQDNGCGIMKENIEHLFEPYFSTKGKNGTGLGLYMSQMIVQKQFGGNINIKSTDNGATFIVDIPRELG